MNTERPIVFIGSLKPDCGRQIMPTVTRLTKIPMATEIDPRLIHPDIEWTVESAEQALGRYSGFGRDTHTALFRRWPFLEQHLVFLHNQTCGDVWSFCNHPRYQFGLQLDADLEVICPWTPLAFDEIGTWVEKPVETALDWLATHAGLDDATKDNKTEKCG